MTGARRCEVPRDATEEQCIGESVGYRVEERAALGRQAGCFGYCPVERVGYAGEDQQQQPETKVAGADGYGRAACHRDADDRDDIGSDPGVAQTLTDRGQTPFDRRPPMAVEHSNSWMSPVAGEVTVEVTRAIPELRRTKLH